MPIKLLSTLKAPRSKSSSPEFPSQWVYVVVTTLLFAIAFTQDPVYISNQTTKFLHGLAQAGLGNLQEDWLANTINPLPAFTVLVRWSYTWFGKGIFYVYPLFIFGIYVYSLTHIVAKLFRIHESVPKFLSFFALFLLIHGVRTRLFGVLKTEIFYEGLAEQYIIDHYFHPAVLGVFIPWSMYLMWVRRPWWAVLLLAIAATFHPAYLPSAALLTLAYMVISWQPHRSWQPPLLLGAIALITLLPVSLYMVLTFQPTTAELFQQSKDILVNIRIPHHSVPERWLTSVGAIIQVAMMAGAIYLARRTELFWMLAIPFGSAVALTLMQVIVRSDSLAFTAPWRVSAFLMPVSLVILLAALVTWVEQRWARSFQVHNRAIALGACVVIGIILVGNVFDQIAKFRAPDPARAMMTYVRDTTQPGEVYLIPDGIETYLRLAPMWKFRLFTGAPILVNVKSHPYKDIEVVEWFERVQLMDEFYQGAFQDRCQVLQRIRDRYDLSHVVMPTRRRDLPCPEVSKRYEDENYQVYSIAN
jgi:hypothetical protein